MLMDVAGTPPPGTPPKVKPRMDAGFSTPQSASQRCNLSVPVRSRVR